MSRVVLAAVVAAVAAWVGPSRVVAQADAADRKKAGKAFEQGLHRFEQGDYEAALDSFQEAYRLAPNPKVRVNMANCYQKLDRPLEALFHYERFLEEERDASPQRRQEVQDAMEELDNDIARVTFDIVPDGARVKIGDQGTRRAPIPEEVPMTAGTHEIEVSLEEYRTVRRELTLEGGEGRTVQITLEHKKPAGAATTTESETETAAGAAATATSEQPTETPDADTQTSAQKEPPSDTAPAEAKAGAELEVEPEPEPASAEPEPSAGATHDAVRTDRGGWEFRPTAGFVFSLSATLAFAATGIATGVYALRADEDFDQSAMRSNRQDLSPQERGLAAEEAREHETRAERLALASDIFLFGLTTAAAGTTLYFFISDGMESSEVGPNPDEPRAGEWTLTPSATRQGGGAVLHGRF